MFQKKSFSILLTIPTLLALGLSGCDDDNTETDGVDAPDDGDRTPDNNDDGTLGDGINFSPFAAEEEGYWYSRYNLGALVMRSGLGDTFMPEMEMVEKMVKMADADPDDGDAPSPPKNPALLKTVFASGEPHFVETFDVGDLGTQRWDAGSFDKTVTARAMGWTIIKELEWSKQFHGDDHFGTIDSDFGAQWRFVGLVLTAEAKMQAKAAMEMLLGDSGYYADSDGTIDYGGQWVLLEAFSNLGLLLGSETLPGSSTNRHRDPVSATMYLEAANSLFDALAPRRPVNIEEHSLALQALVWFGATTQSSEHKSTALDRISTLGNALAAATPGNAVDRAHGVRGLIEAFRIQSDVAFQNRAVRLLNELLDSYDVAEGFFEGDHVYTIDDIGVILGALNAARHFLTDSATEDKLDGVFTGFFEHAVNRSGLQLSAPPKNVGKSPFEQNSPDIFYAYPGIPTPPAAGGQYGIAPVFAGEVTHKTTGYEVTDMRFDSAGAMHTANEMIWFHKDEVNGFPEIN